MKFFAKSDKGIVRKINQDSFGSYVAETGLGFFIVADGMGGHNAGEVASRVAVEAFIEGAKGKTNIVTEKQAAEFIKTVFQRANDIILYKAQADAEMSGMGTTAVAAVVVNEKIIIGNLGDSRAYYISEGKIEQITEDHSYVGLLLKSGTIKDEEARVHPRRNEITKAVGVPFYCEPDIFEIEYKKDSVLLLCTDGLDKMIEDKDIMKIISSSCEPEKLCTALVNAANEVGGTDNITVLTVMF